MNDFRTPLDVSAVRADFPVLARELRPGISLVYLDSAATSQKPEIVIETMNEYYRRYNANVHRGVHQLSEEATAAYESARKRIASFINASTPREVIFTRNTSEGINLLAQAWGRSTLKPGDVVISTQMEHHSNIVPWQILAEQTGIEVRWVPITDDGYLDMEAYHNMLDERVKLVTFAHMSNVLGTIQPVREMTAAAHAVGALVHVDGAQGVPHLPVDVQALGVDFYTFSGHKMLGPTGIGVLWGRLDLLDRMPPWMGGGDMIKRVTLEGSAWNDLPYKFEAGTPSIAEAIGLGAAIDYLEGIGMETIHAHEQAITAYALERLAEVPGLHVLGPTNPAEKGGVAAMILDGIHPHDVAQILDHEGVAVRAGHHCAQPVHQRYQVVASTRASFYLYTTFEEIDRLIEGLYKVKEMFAF
ncbi:MAG: cysteine desulfurase [Aggregatilineales bacterium]|nr:cysteine desulfurase [Chloroflexota bacterium]HOA25276.1 cysteine desulfurase [Aggregatilineales bacterium]HPV07489.1 cysteine desulfurase [Aggregatilineales bacterium]